MTQTDQPVDQPRTLSPRDLWSYEGPLFVENLTYSKLVHDDGKGNILELGPVTSEARYDMLPLEIAKNSSFQKVWRRGDVRVSTDPEMEAVLELADHRIAKADAERQKAYTDLIDNTREEKSLVTLECLECKRPAFLTNADITLGAPPLCLDHKHLSASWVSEEDFDKDKGEVVTKWQKISIGSPQKGLPEGPSRNITGRPRPSVD